MTDELAARRARNNRRAWKPPCSPNAPQTPDGQALAEILAVAERRLRELETTDPDEARRVSELARALATTPRRDLTP